MYSIAPNGVFWSIQGEGHLRGFQMAFMRLAGCSVNCSGCDTNYSVAEKMTTSQIVDAIARVRPKGDRDGWVWVTGGEPTDRDLQPVLRALGAAGHRVALATSGVRPMVPPVDWLSVSPHSTDAGKFRQRYGNEIKVVDGLADMDMTEFVSVWDNEIDFMYRYVQPLSRVGAGGRYEECETSLERCLAFLKKNPRWALSRQDHHRWGVA